MVGESQTPEATAKPTLEPVRDGTNGVLNAQESADVQNAWNRLLRWSRIRLRYAATPPYATLILRFPPAATIAGPTCERRPRRRLFREP